MGPSLLYIERERESVKRFITSSNSAALPGLFRCVVNKSQSTKRPSQSCRLRNFSLSLSLSDLRRRHKDGCRQMVPRLLSISLSFASAIEPEKPQGSLSTVDAVNREGIVHHSELLSLHRRCRRSSSVITQCHNTCRYRLAFERFKLFFRLFTTTSPPCPSLVCYKSLKPRCVTAKNVGEIVNQRVFISPCH